MLGKQDQWACLTQACQEPLVRKKQDLQNMFNGTSSHLDQVLSKYKSTDKMVSSLPVYAEQFIDLEEKG